MKRAIAVFASFAACAALAQVPIYTRPTAASGAAIPSTITGGTNNSVLFVNPAATISQDNPNFTYTIGTTTLTAPIITSGTNFLGNDGTVTTPGFGWTNDNDGTGTGLYRRAANVVTFSTNGVATAEVAGTRLNMNSGVIAGWSASASTVNAMDTGISRTGAAAMAFGNGTAADTTASLSFGKVAKNGGATASGNFGVPTLVATGRATAQAAAIPNLSSFLVGAADGSFEVSGNVLITTATAHAFTMTVAYTDEGNTARVLTLQFSSLAGTFLTSIANAAGAVPYEGAVMHIRVKTATTIQCATTGTFTTVTYNAECFIKQTN